MPLSRLSCTFLALLLTAAPAAARCIPVTERQDQPRVMPARYLLAEKAPAKTPGAIPDGMTQITFIGHSSFYLRTHKGATAVTDYNGNLGGHPAPDVATMNHAHSTHYTLTPDPAIKHVLKGWIENGKIPRHDVRVKDLRVTNVPTNIRENLVTSTGIAGNSIFIFESAGLCIAHLGHLHHRMKPGHNARLGIVDIMLAPVDDGLTIRHAVLSKVIDDLNPVVIIPMHFGWGGTLPRFLEMMKEKKYAIRRIAGPTVRFAKATLPRQRTVVVLEGSH